MKIAIFGGTSHIAKGLIYKFCEQPQDYSIDLFVRSFEKMNTFLNSCNLQTKCSVKSFMQLNDDDYDVKVAE